MNTVQWVVLLVFLVFVIVILSIRLISNHRKISFLCNEMDQILSGNFNYKIKLQNHLKNIERITSKINSLTGQLYEMQKEKDVYKEQNKKMISNISHDLRTPLTSLLGYIEMIKTNDQLNEDEKKTYLDIIWTKGNALSNLMDTFFHLAKLESNDMKLNRIKVNLSEIIRQTVVQFYGELEQLKLDVKLDLPKADLFMLADEPGIGRILCNLISNSIKYGADGGCIGIKMFEEDQWAVCEVWDQGKGIPQTDIPFVFDRLYTLEDSRNKTLQGNGIGLAIVKKLVEMHNGKISVHSVPGEKTSFTFWLPKS